MAALRGVWVEAGLRMGPKRRDGTPMTADELGRSETIPKLCIVASAADGGSIAMRYFTPQTAHASMAVSGGCCLAAATLIPGSIAHRIARASTPVGREFSESSVAVENPAGVLNAAIVARMTDSGLGVRSAAFRLSAQVLLHGYVPPYCASIALHNALMGRSASSETKRGRAEA